MQGSPAKLVPRLDFCARIQDQCDNRGVFRAGRRMVQREPSEFVTRFDFRP